MTAVCLHESVSCFKLFSFYRYLKFFLPFFLLNGFSISLKVKSFEFWFHRSSVKIWYDASLQYPELLTNPLLCQDQFHHDKVDHHLDKAHLFLLLGKTAKSEQLNQTITYNLPCQLTVGENLYSKHFATMNTATPIRTFIKIFFFFFSLDFCFDFFFVINSSDSELKIQGERKNSLENVFGEKLKLAAYYSSS